MITGKNTVVVNQLSKVTKEYIESRIASVHYFQPFNGSTMTICNIVLDNGFGVIGESACVDPANFNRELGESYAADNAREKLWPLFDFLLAEKRKEQDIPLTPVQYSGKKNEPLDPTMVKHPHEVNGEEPAFSIDVDAQFTEDDYKHLHKNDKITSPVDDEIDGFTDDDFSIDKKEEITA